MNEPAVLLYVIIKVASPIQVLAVSQLCKQLQRHLLVGQILRVVERGVHVASLDRGQVFVPAFVDGVPGHRDSLAVRGVGLGGTAEDVSGNLVQEDDQRQGAFAVALLDPIVVSPVLGRLVVIGKDAAQMLIVCRAAVPEGLFFQVVSGAFASEPEILRLACIPAQTYSSVISDGEVFQNTVE